LLQIDTWTVLLWNYFDALAVMAFSTRHCWFPYSARAWRLWIAVKLNYSFSFRHYGPYSQLYITFRYQLFYCLRNTGDIKVKLLELQSPRKLIPDLMFVSGKIFWTMAFSWLIVKITAKKFRLYINIKLKIEKNSIAFIIWNVFIFCLVLAWIIFSESTA